MSLKTARRVQFALQFKGDVEHTLLTDGASTQTDDIGYDEQEFDHFKNMISNSEITNKSFSFGVTGHPELDEALFAKFQNLYVTSDPLEHNGLSLMVTILEEDRVTKMATITFSKVTAKIMKLYGGDASGLMEYELEFKVQGVVPDVDLSPEGIQVKPSATITTLSDGTNAIDYVCTFTDTDNTNVETKLIIYNINDFTTPIGEAVITAGNLTGTIAVASGDHVGILKMTYNLRNFEGNKNIDEDSEQVTVA